MSIIIAGVPDASTDCNDKAEQGLGHENPDNYPVHFLFNTALLHMSSLAVFHQFCIHASKNHDSQNPVSVDQRSPLE